MVRVLQSDTAQFLGWSTYGVGIVGMISGIGQVVMSIGGCLFIIYQVRNLIVSLRIKKLDEKLKQKELDKPESDEQKI